MDAAMAMSIIQFMITTHCRLVQGVSDLHYIDGKLGRIDED